jgi:hypothetical protein
VLISRVHDRKLRTFSGSSSQNEGERYLFLLIVLGLSSYLVLPQFARIGHALEVASTLKAPFVALFLGSPSAQLSRKRIPAEGGG